MIKQVNKILEIMGDASYTCEQNAENYFLKCVEDGHFDKYIKDEFWINPKSYDAHTIDDKDLGYNETGKFTLIARVHEDYYKWINFFIVIFDDGRNFVIGDFEKVVIASTKKHYNIFLNNVRVENWGYGDI